MSEQQPSLQPLFLPAESKDTSVWKAAYEKVIWESDPIKLLAEIHATEEALSLRLQEIGNDASHAQELATMAAASTDILAIKVHRLGWPDLCR